jgi:hypothetical protein
MVMIIKQMARVGIPGLVLLQKRCKELNQVHSLQDRACSGLSKQMIVLAIVLGLFASDSWVQQQSIFLQGCCWHPIIAAKSSSNSKLCCGGVRILATSGLFELYCIAPYRCC